METIFKIIQLFINRKDKHRLAKEKLDRRSEFFIAIQHIDELNITEHEKIARKNALAQFVVGSQLVSYALIDYLINETNVVNFEVVAKQLAFWDTCLIFEKSIDNKIENIYINNSEYLKEKMMLGITILGTIVFFTFSLLGFKETVNWLSNNLLLTQNISILMCLILQSFILIIFIAMMIIIMTFFDLKRVVNLISQDS